MELKLHLNQVFYIYRHTILSQIPWDKFHSDLGVEFIYAHEGEGSLMYFQTLRLYRVKAKIPETGSYIRSKLLLEPPVLKFYMEQFTILQRFFLHLRQSNLDCQVIQVTAHHNLTYYFSSTVRMIQN